MNFRKDINGLRAIAVIAVVLFHFSPSTLPGGFAGVDVFFVISGFLMTGIIFRGFENNNFSLLSFYISRINRIIPALAALCITLLLFGWFYLNPIDYKALSKHAAGSISFISNILYWSEAGYFDATSQEKWLLHTWSLSIEWQFYMFYPLLLIFFNKLIPQKNLKYIVISTMLISFILSVLYSYKSPSASYYLLPTRAWEMLLGGTVYLFPIRLNKTSSLIYESLGIALIIFSYFLTSSSTLWPGYMALFPTLGAAFIILSKNNSILTNNSFCQKIGKWSYSIYLWHWPLAVVNYNYSLNIYYMCVSIILSFLLGYISYTYIEGLKFKRITKWLHLYKIIPIYFVLVIFTIGSIVFLQDGVNNNIRRGANTAQSKFLNLYATQHRNLDDAYWLKCNTYTSLNKHKTYDTAPECTDNKGNNGIFLWGDSHAEALSLGLRTVLKSQNIDFYQKTSAGCHASLEKTNKQTGIFKKACDHSNLVALTSIEAIKPDIVIIAQANQHDQTDWNAISEKLIHLVLSIYC